MDDMIRIVTDALAPHTDNAETLAIIAVEALNLTPRSTLGLHPASDHTHVVTWFETPRKPA